MNSCRLLADGPRCLLPAILAFGLVVSSVRGQELPIELQDIPVPELRDGNRAHEGVYLDDSFEAESLLQEASEHAAAADWNTALDKLDRTLKQYERKVIASGDAAYISVRRFVHAQIARWPADGLRAYRKRYEPAAKSLLAQAVEDHDEEKLWDVFGHYFCTASAVQAADLLSQMLLEQGRLGETRSIFDRLLADHPDRQRFMQEWRAKQAVYQALSGRVEQAKTHLHDTEHPIADYAMEWRGGRTVVQNILEEIEANPILESDSADVRGWPTFGGNASRTLLPRSNISPTAPLWTFDRFAPSTLSGADGYFQSSSYRSAYNC